MQNSKKIVLSTLLTLGLVSAVGVTGAYAFDKVGTVTGQDGDVKDKISMTAQITSVDGSHVVIKDLESNKLFETSFGPSWYTKAYNVGDKIKVIGVETEEDNNDNDHNFQTLSVDGKTVRDSFEGRPLWAGSRNGEGTGNNENRQNGTGAFVDNNKDGVCDNID